ncbi:MAG: vWA domain-containing protein [Deltaproteobacteria bacterium]
MLFVSLGLSAAACSVDSRQVETLPIPPFASGSGAAASREGPTQVEPQPPARSDSLVSAAACAPLIQFVVDTSGSMNWVAGTERVPMSDEQSKWKITQPALAAAIAGLPDDVVVGLTYYPNTSQQSAECYRPEVGAALAPLSAEHRTIIQQVNQATTPFGGTPTHAAYEFGVQQLQASTLEGPRFSLLLTDGIPTYTRECAGNGRERVDSAPLIRDVEADLQSGIRTFVIGLPGSEEARAELSRMASVGGTAPPGCSHEGPSFCHFDTTSEADFSRALNRALAESTQSTLACD